MTKYICLSLCAGLLVAAGCSNSEFEPAAGDGAGGAIGVAVSSGRQAATRAGIITTDSLKSVGQFYLWGYEASGVNYIDKLDPAEVKWNQSSGPNMWTYGDNGDPGTQAQWPTAPSNFVALGGVALSDLTAAPAAGDAATVASLSYAVPSDRALQKDLLTASAMGLTKGTNNGKVDVGFTHALSAVAVRARTAAPGQEVTVTSLQLLNIKTSGDMDMTTGAWSNQAGVAAAPVTISPPAPAKVTEAASYLLPPDDPYLLLPQTTQLGDWVYNAAPQQITDALADGKFYLAVSWNFEEPDGSTSATRTSLCAVAAAGVTPIEFERNKIYTLNLVLDAYSRQIVFDAPVVSDWTAAATIDANPQGVEVAGMTLPNVTNLPSPNGKVVKRLLWSRYNVSVPKSFTSSISDVGLGYEWTTCIGWPYSNGSAGTAVDGSSVTSYPTPPSNASSWQAANPCPEGWRIPTVYDAAAMIIAANGVCNATPTTNNCKAVVVNGVTGIAIKLPNGTLFFPCLPGKRIGYNGFTGSTTTGAYMRVDLGTSTAYRIYLSQTDPASTATTIYYNDQDPNTMAMAIRCVKELD
jgi:uncharacterized protein (TIGR02145 family)